MITPLILLQRELTIHDLIYGKNKSTQVILSYKKNVLPYIPHIELSPTPTDNKNNSDIHSSEFIKKFRLIGLERDKFQSKSESLLVNPGRTNLGTFTQSPSDLTSADGQQEKDDNTVKQSSSRHI